MIKTYRLILSTVLGVLLLFIAPASSFGAPLMQSQKVAAIQSLHMCASGYYKNSSGACVHRPAKAPSWPVGASAKCGDGSYSYSQHRRGTCSHHGGVALWR